MTEIFSINFDCDRKKSLTKITLDFSLTERSTNSHDSGINWRWRIFERGKKRRVFRWCTYYSVQLFRDHILTVHKTVLSDVLNSSLKMSLSFRTISQLVMLGFADDVIHKQNQNFTLYIGTFYYNFSKLQILTLRKVFTWLMVFYDTKSYPIIKQSKSHHC